MSLIYGNGLLLCKVVLGSTESISMDDVSTRTQVIGQQFDSREVAKIVERLSSRTFIRFFRIVSSTYIMSTAPILYRTTSHLHKTAFLSKTTFIRHKITSISRYLVFHFLFKGMYNQHMALPTQCMFFTLH